MLKSIRKSSLAAIAGLLVLGAGSASFGGPAATVTINGGTSGIIDGWQITPDVGVTVTSVAEANVVAITKQAVFTTNAPLAIQFKQTPALNSDNGLQITTETVTNSTGTDWTGFTFSVAAPASFGGFFIPPIGAGVNYTSGILNAQHTMVTFTGTQSNGSTSDWGGLSTSDSLDFAAPLTRPGFPPTTFTLVETPMGPVMTAVPLPAAGWQTLATLLALGVVAAGWKGLKV